MSIFLPFNGVVPNPTLLPELIVNQFDQVIYNETRYDFSREEILEEARNKGFEEPLTEDLKYYLHVGLGYKKLIEKEVFTKHQHPAYYMFGVNWNGQWLYGLVGAVHYSEYWNKNIKKHENTLEENEAELVKITHAVDFNFNPIFLAYTPQDNINHFIELKAQELPSYKYFSSNGLEHRMWVIDKDQEINQLRTYFKAVRTAYIADGHHRIESGSIIAKSRNEKGGNPEETPHNFFIANLFSTEHIKVFEFNRLLTNFNGVEEDVFWTRLQSLFHIEKMGKQAVKPTEKRIFGMYYQGEWYQLKPIEINFLDDDPVMQLDLSILKFRLFKPIFGLDNFRNNKLISYQDGTRPIEELEEKVNSKEAKIAFTLCPTSIEEIMHISDLELTMPPKATCIEPKIKSGLISRLLS